MANLKYIGKNILNHTLEIKKGDVSGSSSSTGSFGKLVGDGFSVTNIQNSVNSQNIYVDHGDTSLVTRLVNITSNSDGNTGLKVPSNPLLYYNRHTNPITGQSLGSDYLYIGGGSGTAGGLFLNSTVTVSPFVYSDYGTLHIRAAGATGLLELSSSLDVRLGNNTQLTGSLEFTGNITGSSTSTGSFGKVTISELSNSDLKSVSSSISTRLTTAETELGNTLISSSAQVDLSQATGVAANATNAVNADNIALSADSANTNRYVTFTSTADGDGELRTDAGLLYNPSTNVITATTFNGDLSGNATTATTATSVAFSGITGKPTLLSGSAQIASDISGSWRGALSGSLNIISGSSTSTGSFGRGFFKSHVGVGGANPDDYLTSANNLVIKEAGNGGITIIGGTSNTGNIHFGDGTGSDSRRGMIRYDHSTDKFIFWTAGGEKLNLDSSGNLEVTSGNISGSSTSTGSFGRLESNTFNTTTFNSTEVTSTNLTVTGTITGSSLDVSGNGNFGGNVVVEGEAHV